MPKQLETVRLTLDAWHAGDLDDYVAMVAERDYGERAAPTRTESRNTLERLQRALVETGITLLVIRVDGRFAGYCGLVIGRSNLDEPELAYELLRRYHGHGYATEAARAVVAAAVDTGRTRLWASVADWNDASFRVLEKVGFTRTDRVIHGENGRAIWCTVDLKA